MSRVRMPVWHLSVFLLLAMLVAGLCPSASRAQSLRFSTRFSDVPIAEACSAEISDSSPFHAVLRLRHSAGTRADVACPTIDRDAPPLQPLARPIAEPPLPLPAAISTIDLIDDELRAMGSATISIANARQEVAMILRENSSCSAWFALAEPDPAQKFASLHFRLDDQGESTLSVTSASTGAYYREPYVASAQEDVGRGSFITINAHGAFFQLRAHSDLNPVSGLSLAHSPQRFLHVGDYLGGSLKAQITTLLHEYGHIVGLLPADSGSAVGELLSMQNTRTVLRYCRKQIEASSSRAIVVRR